MTTAAIPSKPAWQAGVTWESREVWDCFVNVFRPGGEQIRFRVNRRQGQPPTVTDPRDRLSDGTAGTTGIWGTLPPQRAGRPRSMTPTEFQRELARLIGAERAAEIVREILE